MENFYKSYPNANRKILLVIDIALLYLAFNLSYNIRFGDGGPGNSFTLFFLVFGLVWWIVTGFNHYGIRLDGYVVNEQKLANLIKAFLLHAFFVCTLIFILKLQIVSRLFLFYTYSISFALIIMSRVFIGILYSFSSRSNYSFNKFVIVGAGNSGNALYNYLNANHPFGNKFMGFFDDQMDGSPCKELIKGKIKDLKTYCLQEDVNEIYFSLPLSSKELINDLSRFADQNFLHFRIIPDFGGIMGTDLNMYLYDNVPILTTRREPLDFVGNKILKRSFDILFSLSVILFIFPIVVPIVALAIKIDSKGPVFFKQLRPGWKNQLFECFKFRSMQVNNMAHVQATKADPRVTRVGRFLRKTNLDEFPQFINVLLGDMSVVGPRPNMIIQLEQYSKLISKYEIRHFVLPGITGMAQVKGYRGETNELELMEKRVEYDVKYIENWSFLLDLKIIGLTVWNMIKGDKRAY
jgi:putative colanic acid biosysnthesis UDP-glucose lipid carrier transferase